jgi:hypothetical protein
VTQLANVTIPGTNLTIASNISEANVTTTAAGNATVIPIITTNQTESNVSAPSANVTAPTGAPSENATSPTAAPTSQNQTQNATSPEAAPTTAPESAPNAAPVAAPTAASTSEGGGVAAPTEAPVSAPAPEAAPAPGPTSSAPESAPAPTAAPEEAPTAAPTSGGAPSGSKRQAVVSGTPAFTGGAGSQINFASAAEKVAVSGCVASMMALTALIALTVGQRF